MKWLGRDPAVLVTQINAGIIALLLLLRFSDVVTAAVGGAVTAVGALIIAAAVRHDGVLAALVGVARTVVVLAVVLGVKWDPAYQILLITAFETVAGIFIRDRVVAPIDQLGQRRARSATVTDIAA